MATIRNNRAPVHQAELTRHELAVRMLINSHPEMHRNGFARAMKALHRELHPDDWEPEDVPPFNCRPDAYRIDRGKSEILIYEVEDTHPLPPTKLYEYAMFWFYWDCEDEHDWLPRVFPVDRYGNVGAELDLMALYYAFLDDRRAA